MNKLVKKFISILATLSRRESLPLINSSQVVQRQLYQTYRSLNRRELKFQDAGFRVYSQADEDGLLLYIFSKIGFTNKLCVDLGSNSPFDSNVTNLLCNWNFQGLLIEGGDICESVDFYATHSDTRYAPPKVVKKWITAENINTIISENNYKGEIDLLSLDIDGVDYWIWKNISVIKPRVVILEYMNIFNHSTSVSVPYDPAFVKNSNVPNFFGASLQAFVKQGNIKGYRLVGCNKYNYNAFFVRKDIRCPDLPTVTPEKCLHSFSTINTRLYDNKYAKAHGWVEV